MPSHIYIRTGDYYEAAQANVDAIKVDREYMTESGNKGLYPMIYYHHNVHFLAARSGTSCTPSVFPWATRSLRPIRPTSSPATA